MGWGVKSNTAWQETRLWLVTVLFRIILRIVPADTREGACVIAALYVASKAMHTIQRGKPCDSSKDSDHAV